MKRGEIRWYTFRLPDKQRPVLILTRNGIIDHVSLAQRNRIGPALCDLSEARWS